MLGSDFSQRCCINLFYIQFLPTSKLIFWYLPVERTPLLLWICIILMLKGWFCRTNGWFFWTSTLMLTVKLKFPKWFFSIFYALVLRPYLIQLPLIMSYALVAIFTIRLSKLRNNATFSPIRNWWRKDHLTRDLNYLQCVERWRREEANQWTYHSLCRSGWIQPWLAANAILLRWCSSGFQQSRCCSGSFGSGTNSSFRLIVCHHVFFQQSFICSIIYLVCQPIKCPNKTDDYST